MFSRTSSTKSKQPVGLIALALATAAAAGAFTVALWPQPEPSALSAAIAPDTFAISRQPFTDDQPVILAVSRLPVVPIPTPAGGKITTLQCDEGTALESGASSISVDGQPILTLATAIPLWRDLAVGDRGADAKALQEELLRLGYPLVVDGEIGKATIAATTKLLAKVGATPTPSTVSHSEFLWIPNPRVTIGECKSARGSNVAAGDEIMTLTPSVASARIVSMPQGLVEGDRVLKVDNMSFPMDANGVVNDPTALAQLAETPSFLESQASPDKKPVSASLALARPMMVSSVPPSSLYDVHGTKACVSAHGRGVVVSITGSQLGQTFVTFAGQATPRSIDLTPVGASSCR